MAATTSDTCIDCGGDASDGPDFTDGRVCWYCSDDRTYIRPYTDFGPSC